MANASEREDLHAKAQILRTRVATWVHGPRSQAVLDLADELDVLAGELEEATPRVGTPELAAAEAAAAAERPTEQQKAAAAQKARDEGEESK